MPQPGQLDPRPFDVDGGPVGILLIHGYTGSVAETRPMGEYLAARGLAVGCPLLPGHGTVPQDLTRIRWQEWAATVEQTLDHLQRRCQAVFVGGLSLGSLLTLWLGAHHPEIVGLILMAPAVKTRNRLLPLALGARYLLKYHPAGPMGSGVWDAEAAQHVWCYDQLPLWGAAEVYRLQRRVRQLLPRIRQSILIFQGKHDRQLPPEAAQLVYDGVSSTDKTVVWLESSGHNLLADGERQAVWAKTWTWMQERLGRREE